MTEQTEAQRLAAALDTLLGYRGINADVGKAAAELRRLEAVNAQLLEALKYCRQKIAYMQTNGEWYSPGRAIDMADAAIAAAKGEA
jgi:hypothetical protein